MAADALDCCQEAVDAEFGASLTARSVALGRGAVGLGPPDLCYLHKSYKSALGLGGLRLLGGTLQVAEDQSAVGYYHHVIGLDTSSPATVSHSSHSTVPLCSAQPPPPDRQSEYGG